MSAILLSRRGPSQLAFRSGRPRAGRRIVSVSGEICSEVAEEALAQLLACVNWRKSMVDPLHDLEREVLPRTHPLGVGAEMLRNHIQAAVIESRDQQRLDAAIAERREAPLDRRLLTARAAQPGAKARERGGRALPGIA